MLKATAETPLIIPEGAVVVPGSRAVTSGHGKEMGAERVYAGDREVSRREDGAVAALEELLR